LCRGVGEAGRRGCIAGCAEHASSSPIEVDIVAERYAGLDDPNGLHFTNDEARCTAERVVPSVGPARLRELAAAPSWKARFGLVDRVLADAMDDAVGAGRHPDPEIVGAWQELERRRGDVSISEIQAATGWSRRRLAARFREQVGLAPKAAARVLRFDRAVELLVRPAPRSLASIALACGYYDQAHFNREFRRLAGCTPSAYLAALYPDAPGAAASPIAATQTSKTPQPVHT
jgi:AraC-like DNA-binding protein